MFRFPIMEPSSGTRIVIYIRSQNNKWCDISKVQDANCRFSQLHFAGILFIRSYAYLWRARTVLRQVSVPHYGTIIRDPYRELHKITKQKIGKHNFWYTVDPQKATEKTYILHLELLIWPLFADMWFCVTHDIGPWWWFHNGEPKHVWLILL
jgi:hypothetical protein